MNRASLFFIFIITTKCTISTIKVISQYIVYTPTCFDISMSSPGSVTSARRSVTHVFPIAAIDIISQNQSVSHQFTYVMRLWLLKLQFYKIIKC